MFVVFVLLVVAVTVILGLDVVKVLGDTGMTGCKCNVYCPWLYIICKLLLVLVTNSCARIYDDDGKCCCCLW